MKPSILQKNKNRLFYRDTFSFPSACVLSVLVHGVIIVIIIQVGNFIKDSDIQREGRYLNVVLGTADAQSAHIQKRNAFFNRSDRPLDKSQLASKPIEPELNPSVDINKYTDEGFDENPLPVEDTDLGATKTDLDAVTRPIHLKMPRMRVSQPRIHYPKLSIQPRQQKSVLENIDKLTKWLPEMVSPDSSFSWESKNQRFTVHVQRENGGSPTALDRVICRVSTNEDGHTLTTEVKMKRLSFSSFAHFVDYWDPGVAAHDDEITGWFHTNSPFAVARDRGIAPTFRGKVTTTAHEVESYGEVPFIDHASIFIGGIETGVKVIRLPKTFSLFNQTQKMDSNHMHRFNEETWITFYRDGSYTWRTKSSMEYEQKRKIPHGPYYIVGDENCKIHIKGTTKGKILVYSEHGVVIDDNLIYTQHPNETWNAEDYLGIVSLRDVEIAPPSVTGPGDLVIHGAIYAKRRFRVRYFNKGENALLKIYGSLSAGSLSATEPRYATRVVFDDRLNNHRPPNFPMTDRYEIVEWDRQWTVNQIRDR